MTPERPPLERMWEDAVSEASPDLAEDSVARGQVMSKLYNQYLPAAFRARTPEADLRVWSSLRYYLTAAITIRKLFSLSDQEAGAVVEAIRERVRRLRAEG